MPILAQTVIDRCTALLDAEGSDHYKFDKDFQPAINNAQVWLINLYNRLFGEKKVSEESLVELTVIRVFKLSNYSRLSFSNEGVVNEQPLLDAVAAEDNGDGTVKIPCLFVHGFDAGNFVTIDGTDDYDGVFQIQGVDSAATFNILISEVLAANGWNDAVPVTITSIGATATVVHTAHGLLSDSEVTIAGAIEPEYNGNVIISYVDDNSYEYGITGGPASPATGIITSTTIFSAEVFASQDTATVKDGIWSILAIYPSISTIPTAPTGLPADADSSSFITDVAMRKPLVPSATRLTMEEWGEKEVNPLVPGSPLITKSNLIQYAYLDMADYFADTYYLSNVSYELEIAPDIKNTLVAMAYLKQPVDITVATDSLPFPKTMEEMVVMKTLNFLAIKDDDREDLYSISDEEITKAIQLLS